MQNEEDAQLADYDFEYGFGAAKHFMPLPNTVVGSHCAWELRLNTVPNRIPGKQSEIHWGFEQGGLACFYFLTFSFHKKSAYIYTGCLSSARRLTKILLCINSQDFFVKLSLSLSLNLRERELNFI